MSADLLRKAAEILRERAENCQPYEGGDGIDSWANEYDADAHEKEHGYYSPDVEYIATMHPGVGLAIADWLDSVARVDLGRGQHEKHDACDRDCDVVRALVVARLIVGEAS